VYSSDSIPRMKERPLEKNHRRDFLKLSALATGAALLPLRAHGDSGAPIRPVFPGNDPRWGKTWDAARAVLAGNVKTVPRYDRPVLVEGSVYPGIWQECGPHEGLVYGTLAGYVATGDGAPTPVQIARNNHMAFFALQLPVGHESAGQFPAAIKMSDVGYGQIQMVVPIAATAWELAQLTSDDELLVIAYTACSRWDAWLRAYRDTRKTGLV